MEYPPMALALLKSILHTNGYDVALSDASLREDEIEQGRFDGADVRSPTPAWSTGSTAAAPTASSC